MSLNSFSFLCLFPVIFAAYYAAVRLAGVRGVRAARLPNFLLLAVSYGLYAVASPVWCLFLLGVTAVTYLFARLIERRQAYGRRRYIVAGATLALLPLGVFKYYNFITDNVADMFAIVGLHVGLPGLNWAVPLGISFFSFQAVGYLFDVYYRRIGVERNWWDYMLFVGFFPQIASGPISKAADLLPQIKNRERPFNYALCVQGLRWLLWGCFLKTVVADRLGLYVDTVFDNYTQMSGCSCLVAAVLFSLQIYADFAGYSLMAIGVGATLGFRLVNNFRRPYMAVSVTDFWRRWHISLTRWLRDYVYIPLGGNRCPRWRNYANIMATFLVSGVWHGANWTFIVWGAIHGVLQIAERAFGLQRFDGRGAARVLRIVATFAVVTFAWVFFRMPTVGDACTVVAKIFSDMPSGALVFSKSGMFCIVAASVALLAKDWVEELTRFSLFANRRAAVRWASYLAVAFSILLFGVLDASTFIYASF